MAEWLKDFDPEKEIENITEWIRQWFSENGPTANAVIGISGGKDSTIVAHLLVRALGKERVIGVLMPDGEQKDIDDSKKVVELLGIKHYVVNIHPAVEAAKGMLADSGVEMGKDAVINTPPRIRMATLYAIAQSVPGGARVANTCNRSEDYVGYSTKYGDAAGDFSPCSDFTVTEMRMIGDALGVPKELTHKTPSDGLSGMSDEDKLGFTYHEVNELIRKGVHGPNYDKIINMYNKNKFKLEMIRINHFDPKRPDFFLEHFGI